MLNQDRDEFNRQIAALCVGFDKPLADKAEVYWLAFHNLAIDEFARMVEFCLSADGPDRFPTVGALWKIRKGLRPEHRPQTGEVATRLVEYIATRYELSSWQWQTKWHWINRWFPGLTPDKQQRDDQGAQCLGVIVPQDPEEPARYPARRVMTGELPPQGPVPNFDDVHRLAQRVMLHWLNGVIRLRAGKPLPEPVLKAVIKRKQELTQTYRTLLADHDPEANERWFNAQFKSVADQTAAIERPAP